MGNCCRTLPKEEFLSDSAAASKAESPRHRVCASAGVKSKSASKDGKVSPTNQVSAVSVPPTPQGRGGCVSAASVPPTHQTELPRSEGEMLQPSNVKKFDFNELKIATRNFHPDNILGVGGFGSVFKGWIDEHTFAPAEPETGLDIAVKMLNPEAYQGHNQWLAEVNYLGHLNNPNLVRLIGYCLEGERRLLVYKFMPQGSLEDHLFRRGPNFQSLSWNLRMKVALGAAKGLAFLHSADIKVIHRDFKSSNVLLDSDFDAKLSDFGMARDGPAGDKSHLSLSVILGTYGYVDPIYLSQGHLTIKSDVYSFGVVLLEMLSGRRAIDMSRPSEEQNLVKWARPYFKSKREFLSVVMDTRMEGQYTTKAALRVATIAGLCLSEDPKLRPNMDEVVIALELFQSNKSSGRASDQSHGRGERS